MTVYNGSEYVFSAVESIINQSYADFELLVVDDGSTDASAGLVEAIPDPRIRLIRSSHRGLVGALNLGLSQARGRYVARMDADDVARVDRLGMQVLHLDARPETGLVCSNVRIIDAAGCVVGVQRESWTGNEYVRDGLLYRRRMLPIIHPSVMMRREVAEYLGGYREFAAAEDRDFWIRALDRYGFDRLDQTLLDYRIHPGGISRESGSVQSVSSAMSVVNWLVLQETGVDLFAEHRDMFAATRAGLHSRVVRDVAPGAVAFRSSRSQFRSGRHLGGVAALVAGVACHGLTSLPDGARRATRKIIDETVVSVSRILTMERPNWTT